MNLSTDENDNNVEVDRAWVEGPLFGATVQAGRVPLFTAQGMIFDDRISGGTVAFGSDQFTTTLAAGRYNNDDPTHKPGYQGNAKDITAEYYGVQFDYQATDNLAANAGYTTLRGIEDTPDNANIWYLGGSYAFDSNVKLVGQYAENTEEDAYEKAGIVEVQYKGTDVADPGSWGAYVGYRHLGKNVAIAPTYDDAAANQKGYVVGASYVPAENILATIEYFDGKDMDTDSDASKFFANVDFFF